MSTLPLQAPVLQAPAVPNDAALLRTQAQLLQTMGQALNANYAALFQNQIKPEDFILALQAQIPGGEKVGTQLIADATQLNGIADRVIATQQQLATAQAQLAKGLAGGTAPTPSASPAISASSSRGLWLAGAVAVVAVGFGAAYFVERGKRVVR